MFRKKEKNRKAKKKKKERKERKTESIIIRIIQNQLRPSPSYSLPLCKCGKVKKYLLKLANNRHKI